MCKTCEVSTSIKPDWFDKPLSTYDVLFYSTTKTYYLITNSITYKKTVRCIKLIRNLVFKIISSKWRQCIVVDDLTGAMSGRGRANLQFEWGY